MDLKFLPYRLEPCINNYKYELLFVGSTYYEKYNVFEHIKNQAINVLGFPVERVELAFEEDRLVNVWLFTSEYKLDDLLNVFEAYFDRKPVAIDLEDFIEHYNSIQFYWGDDEYIVGVGIRTPEHRAYIYITLKEANLYHIAWEE